MIKEDNMLDKEISMRTKSGVYTPGNVVMLNDTKYLVVRVIANGCTDTVELQEMTEFIIERHYIEPEPGRTITISDYIRELSEDFEKRIPISAIGGEK